MIGADGTDLGVMSTRDAVRFATEAGLDLVETNPKATPPVCEIVSFELYRRGLIASRFSN